MTRNHKPAAEAEPLRTIPQAAKALGISAATLRAAIKRGDIPHYAPFNSRVFVRLSEVLAFIEAQRSGRAS